MVAFNHFECFAGDVGLEKHELNADTLKIYLSNAAPSAASDTVLVDCADISAENGYSAGGADTTNTFSEASGTGTLAGTDVTWTATSGTSSPSNQKSACTYSSAMALTWQEVQSSSSMTMRTSTTRSAINGSNPPEGTWLAHPAAPVASTLMTNSCTKITLMLFPILPVLISIAHHKDM